MMCMRELLYREGLEGPGKVQHDASKNDTEKVNAEYNWMESCWRKGTTCKSNVFVTPHCRRVPGKCLSLHAGRTRRLLRSAAV